MSESADYVPAPHWSGYDFGAAKREYYDKASARRDEVKAVALDPSSLVPDKLSAESESPLIIAIDVTGSMDAWPATIFSKLPYLEHEAHEYLGDDVEISFAAIGDVTHDKYPLQIQPFVSERKLKESLEKLIIERGGGGSSEESYDMAALYYSRNCECPNAIRKPIMIIIGDEGIYSNIFADRAKACAKVDVEDEVKAKKNPLTPKRLFAELSKKYSVYVVRKPYNCSGNSRSPADLRIENQWIDFLGEDHVVNLPEAERVVDVIFGILAKETGREEYFEDELKERQGKDKGGDKKISIVLNSLRSLHGSKSSKKKLPAPKDARSVTRGKTSGGPRSISLLDDDDDE